MPDIKGLRIVVAEDDEVSLSIIMKILKDYGHEGRGFTDGHLAWAYMCQRLNDIDMVILDKKMLNRDGMEVVRRMKNHQVLKNLPIIIQSGEAFPDKIKEAVDAGVDRYITKPFSDMDLLKVIEDVAKQYKLKSIRV